MYTILNKKFISSKMYFTDGVSVLYFLTVFTLFLKKYRQCVLLSDNWDLRSWRVLVLIQVRVII